MAPGDTEPFPTVTPPRAPPSRKESHRDLKSSMTRPHIRRKSSTLGGEPRGDTGAVALATLFTPSTASIGIGSPSDNARPHSKRRKARSLLSRWVRISLRHTWLNPLILILAVLSLYATNPTPSNPIHSAIFLSYPLPRSASAALDAPVQYGKGRADFAFVAFYIVVLSFTREFLMQRLLRPLAIRLGIRSRAKQSRFMEQFYTAIYFGVYGPFGLYVMSRSPVWYFNTRGMFENFPHYTHEAMFKTYYLLQASYWAQQAIVLLLMLEKPRKDFKELVLHHVVTLSLIWLSYRFHFTYMGIAVYITHDISDFFLATSKVLNYIDSPITAPYFAFFMAVWAYLRHYINLRILYAVLTEFRTVGPFELNWETQQYKCWISQIITFGLLAMLQAVNLFWFFLIARIAWRIVMTSVAADDRSDDEYTEEEIAERKEQALHGMANGNSPDGKSRPTGPRVLLNGLPVEGDKSTMDDVVAVEYEEKPSAARRRK